MDILSAEHIFQFVAIQPTENVINGWCSKLDHVAQSCFKLKSKQNLNLYHVRNHKFKHNFLPRNNRFQIMQGIHQTPTPALPFFQKL